MLSRLNRNFNPLNSSARRLAKRSELRAARPTLTPTLSIPPTSRIRSSTPPPMPDSSTTMTSALQRRANSSARPEVSIASAPFQASIPNTRDPIRAQATLRSLPNLATSNPTTTLGISQSARPESDRWSGSMPRSILIFQRAIARSMLVTDINESAVIDGNSPNTRT